MIYFSRPLFAALVLLAAPVYASKIPQSSKFDNRIQYVNYNSRDVVVVKAIPGLGARIVFDPDEKILDAASGFTKGWEFKDRRNILYIKPRSIKAEHDKFIEPEAGKWNTNLMVTTNVRMYDFDLQLIDNASASLTPNNQKIAYRIEFRYPEEEAAKAKIAAAKKAEEAKFNVSSSPRNWQYTMQVGKNSEGIAPTETYDDGRFTYLKFPNNRDFPAVFLVADDKTESIVNTHVENDKLIVERVAQKLMLRLGNAVVGIYNENFDRDGISPEQGTTVPGIKRVITAGGESNHG